MQGPRHCKTANTKPFACDNVYNVSCRVNGAAVVSPISPRYSTHSAIGRWQILLATFHIYRLMAAYADARLAAVPEVPELRVGEAGTQLVSAKSVITFYDGELGGSVRVGDVRAESAQAWWWGVCVPCPSLNGMRAAMRSIVGAVVLGMSSVT